MHSVLLFFPAAAALVASAGVVAASLPLFFAPAVVEGFRPPPFLSASRCAAGIASSTTSTSSSPPVLVALAARKAGKKAAGTGKRKRAASAAGGGRGGGFGAATAATAQKQKKEDDDYAVFPKLEPSVLETLVPAPTATETPEGESGEEAGELPPEIYHRLAQLYGLPNFNFEQQENGGGGGDDDVSNGQSLLGDILSTPSAAAPGGGDALRSLLSSAADDADAAVNDRSSSPPGADLALNSLPPFRKLRVLHVDPLVLGIDDFFTDEECDEYVAAAEGKRRDRSVMQSRSPTVGKDAAAKAQRTSTTFYNFFADVPEFMAKATRLLGLDDIEHWEEPQTVRYRRNERFTWHLDALGPTENQQHLGGQRIATLLVYHTTLDESDGGATVFRDLRASSGDPDAFLKVRPKKGSALLFFPAAGGIPDTPFDIRTLHCGEVVREDASTDKWISQLWLRHSPYKPTAPPGNDHAAASDPIRRFCLDHAVGTNAAAAVAAPASSSR